MITIGKVREISVEEECEVEWKVEKCTAVSIKKRNKWYHSPEFSFTGATWGLGICAKDDKNEQAVGYINIFLFKKSSEEPISLDYSLVMKSKDDKTNLVKHCSSTYDRNGEGYGASDILKTSEFLKRKPEFVPNDVLTIICKLRRFVYDSDINEAEIAECSHCKKTHITSIHEKKCLDKPVKCQECYDVIKLKDWYEHACGNGTERATVYEKMSQNFKDILESGEHSDITILVKDVEFRLHRSILAARNKFFDDMFKEEIKEKNTGTVTIDNCEPDVFRQFAHFLYVGKVEKMTPENVCSLYEISNKYQEEQLKEDCLNFMLNGISVESFCDFIIVALKFDENKLLEKTKEYFISRPKEIVRHVKWQDFAKEYASLSNELIMATLDHHVK